MFFNFQVDFGEVFIPPGLDVPKPRVLPEFKRLAHGLRSSNISILDAKTFYIPNLHYDGAGPDAYFWIGNGSEPNIMGFKVTNLYKSKFSFTYKMLYIMANYGYRIAFIPFSLLLILTNLTCKIKCVYVKSTTTPVNKYYNK